MNGGERSGCFTWLGLGLLLVLGVFLWASWAAMQAAGARVFGAFALFVEQLLQLVLFVGGIFAGVVIAALVAMRISRLMTERNERLRQRDGSYALVRSTVKLSDGGKATLVIDPNRMIGAAVAVTDGGQVVEMLDRSLLPEYRRAQELRAGVARVQALAPGDRAVEQMRGQYRLPGSAWRVSNPPRPEPHLIGMEEDAERPLPGAPPMPEPLEALRMSTATEWVLGWGEAGPYKLNWLASAHALLLGTTGMGKSQSTLTHMLMLAARHGQAVMLDGKGAGEYDELEQWIEYHRAEPQSILGHLRRLEELALERREMLRRAGVKEWRKLPDSPPRLWLFFDEFNFVRGGLDGAALTQFDGSMLGALSQWRVYGMHWVIADQRPDRLPRGYRTIITETLVYRLGGGAAAAVNEYKAHELQQGEFLANGTKYRAWLMAPAAPRLLETGRVQPVLDRLLPDFEAEPVEGEWHFAGTSVEGSVEGSAKFGEVGSEVGSTSGSEAANFGEVRSETGATPPPYRPDFDVRSAPKRDVIVGWMEYEIANGREPRQADFKRWLAAAGREISEGYISDVFNGKA